MKPTISANFPQAIDPLPPFAGGERLAGYGVSGSPNPPRPRRHGTGAPAAGPQQRPPRGDLPPRRLPRRPRPRVSRVRLLPPPHQRPGLPPPLILGFLSNLGFQPAEAPHPSAAVARAVASAADFSIDFLRRPTKLSYWVPCDVRDGRVLVEYRSSREVDGKERFSWDLAVCDPLFRRYLLLPPVADDLLASFELQIEDLYSGGASFIPSGDMEETSFSVIRWAHSLTKLVVLFFSSGSDHWTVGTSTSWDDIGLHEEVDSLGSCHCVYGCFYWKVNYANKLLKLDTNTMELSAYDLPHDQEKGDIIGVTVDIIIVESGEGKVAMFSLVGASTSLQYYNLVQNGTEKSHEWHMKSTIPLPVQYASNFFMNGSTEGYIFLEGSPNAQCGVLSAFSLEIKSFKIERVSMITSRSYDAIPYFGFPPFMSSRRIQ